MSLLSAGKFVCDTPLQIVKKFDTQVVMSDDGKKMEKVYGQWATKKDNFIKFRPGEPVVLDAETVALPHVTQLIEHGVLKRVF